MLAHLASIEANLTRLDQRIEARKMLPKTTTSDQVRGFVLENVMRLRGLLRGNAGRARNALTKHIKQLVLTPEETATGPVYAVAGTMSVPVSKECVMPVVARESYRTAAADMHSRATNSVALISDAGLGFRRSRTVITPGSRSVFRVKPIRRRSEATLAFRLCGK
jgi:hypothetical protein